MAGSRGRGSPLIEDKYFFTYDASYLLDLWIWWLCLLLVLPAYVFEYMDVSNLLDEMWWVDPFCGSTEVHETKARAGKGKEAPNEKEKKCYKLPMQNKVHRYLNTTRYAWYIVSMLCFNCNIDGKVSPKAWWECLFLCWLTHAYESDLDPCLLCWNDAPGVEHFDLLEFYEAI